MTISFLPDTSEGLVLGAKGSTLLLHRNRKPLEGREPQQDIVSRPCGMTRSVAQQGLS